MTDNRHTDDRTKTEPPLGTLLIYTATIACPCSRILSKEDPLTLAALSCGVLHVGPGCQPGLEATMNIKYWAGPHLINVNNMQRENLSDEKSTYIFSGHQTECKWLWKI